MGLKWRELLNKGVLNRRDHFRNNYFSPKHKTTANLGYEYNGIYEYVTM